MNNEHTRIQELLCDTENGGLASEDQRRVENHLLGCRECRQFLQRNEELATAIRSFAQWEQQQHIPEYMLARYFQTPDDLDGSQRDRVETHLLLCRSCAAELDLLKQLPDRLQEIHPIYKKLIPKILRGRGRIPRLFGRPAFAYGVAMAAILLLGYPAGRYLAGLSSRGYAQHPGITTETVFPLTERMRGGNDYVDVTRSSTDAVIRLALSFWPDPARAYDILITGEDGHTFLQTALSVRRLDQGNVHVSVNSAVLRDGKYLLVARGISRSDPSDTLRTVFPFKIRTQP